MQKLRPLLVLLPVLAIVIAVFVQFPAAAQNGDSPPPRSRIVAENAANLVPFLTLEQSGGLPVWGPDGQTLAVRSRSGVSVYSLDDLEEEPLTLTHRGNADPIALFNVDYSPNGDLLASGGDDDAVKVWDALSGDLLVSLEGHSDAVQIVTFSPDGTLLASYDAENVLIVWGIDPDAPLFVAADFTPTALVTEVPTLVPAATNEPEATATFTLPPDPREYITNCDLDYDVVSPLNPERPPLITASANSRLARASEIFEFTVVLENTSDCDWPAEGALELVFIEDTDPLGLEYYTQDCDPQRTSLDFNFTNPRRPRFIIDRRVNQGDEFSITVSAEAPRIRGCYFSAWQLQFASYDFQPIGEPLVLSILVFGGE